MRKEIGSEFWNVPVNLKANTLLPEYARLFISGRVALRYIIKDIMLKKKVQTIGLPSWCCDSIITPFIDEGLEVQFYPVVLENGVLKQRPNDITVDVLLVMDYFGTISHDRYDSYPCIIIRDLTHSIFSKYADDADYYFGSVRKWCGIVTGGFAWSKKGFSDRIAVHNADLQYINNRQRAMEQKANYINGIIDQKDYLQLFSSSEQFLDDLKEIQCGKQEDADVIKHIDIDTVTKKRHQNAKILKDKLSQYLFIPDFDDGGCPLFVPILLNNRDAIRNFLIEREVYCPVHWPGSKNHVLTEQMLYIYNHELSIVCDQRYNASDIERMADLILKGIIEC